MYENINISSILNHLPHAVALVQGGENYPKINGIVKFYQLRKGVMVTADVSGLPKRTKECLNPIFGFHIHTGTACCGNEDDPFADTLTHYNPDNRPHPYHAGDMPPLFGNNGNAYLAFLTDRFTVKEIAGRTLVIHSNPDDFTTQPAGNSGDKIACGKIKFLR